MIVVNKIFRNLIFLGILFLFPSWGWVGHQIISSSVAQVFTGEMAQFNDWVQFLTDHASDADYRKSDDPEEGPKHYLDVDNYPEFVADGRIPSTLDSCIDRHGEEFVKQNGYLPWATLDSYETLVDRMKNADWEVAQVAAADLGHYVADGFMPFHITRNYNGQFSGNEGIHFRYESDMVNAYQSEIILDVNPFISIDDPATFIFSYLYENYTYVEELLAADDYAKTEGDYKSAYYAALWELTGDLTIELFSGASQAFASLLHAAWVEAEKPDLNGEASPIEMHPLSADRFRPWPNPFIHSMQIDLEISCPGSVNIRLLNSIGKLQQVVYDGDMGAGSHRIQFQPDSLSSGVYFLVFRNEDGMMVRRIMKQ